MNVCMRNVTANSLFFLKKKKNLIGSQLSCKEGILKCGHMEEWNSIFSAYAVEIYVVYVQKTAGICYTVIRRLVDKPIISADVHLNLKTVNR
jgi:hypothetical protein